MKQFVGERQRKAEWTKERKVLMWENEKGKRKNERKLGRRERTKRMNEIYRKREKDIKKKKKLNNEII